MVEALILKLNGWPSTFDERIGAIAESVNKVTVIRPRPSTKADSLHRMDNVVVYDLPPERESFVEPQWLKPIIFSLHVIQAILIMTYLFLRGRLPPVIHALDYALGGMAGAVVSRVFSVPLVVSVRGPKEPRYKQFVEQEKTLWASFNYYILRVMTNFVLASADHVVTKAPYQVDFVKETFGVNPGFSTIPTGVDFNIFNPEKTTAAGNISEFIDDSDDTIADDDVVILYLSKLFPEKGPDKILQHVNELGEDLSSNVKFVFVGEFHSNTFKRQFYELKSQSDDRIVIHPERVSFDKVPGLLATADAVVLLSKPGIEGVPRILQESCAMQTPIIASDVTGITGAFKGLPGCYLVNRDDSQDFTQAIIRVITDDLVMPRELFIERFDMYQNYTKYANIYADFVRAENL